MLIAVVVIAVVPTVFTPPAGGTGGNVTERATEGGVVAVVGLRDSVFVVGDSC